MAALGWLVLAALAYLAPALSHGTKLGPYDLLDVFGLGGVSGVQPHNIVASDQIQDMIPWTDLAWTQVHAGHLPLWDPYNAMGLPLAFNFQSAVFSLPMLVAYLVPMRFAFTVVVIVKMLIAGSGAYVLGRVLGLGQVPAVLAGTVFELSGAFTGWLGWPQAGVFCWAGWLLAGALLIWRGDHRVRDVALTAVALAFAVYGGHPESVAITLATVAVVVVVMVVVTVARRRRLDGVWQPLAALAVAGLAGAALAAPLLLPGGQVLSRSVHSKPFGGYRGLAPSAGVNLLFSGYHGFPIAGSQYFGVSNYYETAAYVGLTALVLAAVGAVWRWRDPRVKGLAVAAVVLAAVVYVRPIAWLVGKLPGVGLVLWSRALVPLDLVLAVLAGVGLQGLLESGRRRRYRRLFTTLAALALLVLLGLGIRQLVGHLAPVPAAIRAHSFLWPAIQAGALIGAAALLWVGRRGHGASVAGRRRGPIVAAAALLCVTEAAFLLTAAPDLWSSNGSGFAATPEEVVLQHLVGDGRVGFGSCTTISEMPSLGILPEANSAYGVAELSALDPATPRAYFSSYAALTGTTIPKVHSSTFCPSVSTAAIARHYGVSYILEPVGHAAPPGTKLVGPIATEDLYRVPGAGVVTVEPKGEAPDGASAVPVRVTAEGPSSLAFDIRAPEDSTVYLHLTDVPGWTATVDGRPLALERWGDVMLSASVGPGNHHVVLSYRPKTFEVGLLLAALAAVGLVVALAVAAWRRRSAGLGDGEPRAGPGSRPLAAGGDPGPAAPGSGPVGGAVVGSGTFSS